MALPSNVHDRENQKFVEDGNGDVAVRVVTSGTTTVDGIVDINDISKGTQTNDVKITLDSEVVTVKEDKASSAGTSTGISVGSSSTTVLAANANRKQAILVNDSELWCPDKPVWR